MDLMHRRNDAPLRRRNVSAHMDATISVFVPASAAPDATLTGVANALDGSHTG
jgi:hypothetical protein